MLSFCQLTVYYRILKCIFKMQVKTHHFLRWPCLSWLDDLQKQRLFNAELVCCTHCKDILVFRQAVNGGQDFLLKISCVRVSCRLLICTCPSGLRPAVPVERLESVVSQCRTWRGPRAGSFCRVSMLPMH